MDRDGERRIDSDDSDNKYSRCILVESADIVLKSEGEIACATRKDSPKFNELLDEFLKAVR